MTTILNLIETYFIRTIIYIRRKSWWFLNKYRFINLGKNSYISKHILLTPSFISINENVFVHRNARIEGVKSYEGVRYKPEIILDTNCTIQQNVHITCAERIYIGRHTAIAANVTITDIDHPYEDISLPIEKQILNVFPVFIGSECKIYNNVVVLPGSKIGNHCTIGANSVVSGFIPDYCVVVGAPAKIIKRYNFEKSEWHKTDKLGNFIK